MQDTHLKMLLGDALAPKAETPAEQPARCWPPRELRGSALAILLGAVVAAGAGIYFLHRYQLHRHAAGLLDEASRAEQAGDVTQALLCLRDYVGLAPRDAEGWSRLGSLWLRHKPLTVQVRRHALAAFENALIHDPERVGTQRDAVRVAIDLRRYSLAQGYVEPLLASHRDDAELESFQGQIDAGLRRFGDAAKHFSKAIRLAPAQKDNYIHLAQALLRATPPEHDRAGEVIRNMITALPRDDQVRLAAARFYQQEQHLDQAREQLTYALGPLHSDRVDIFLLASQVDQQSGRRDDCRRVLLSGLKLHPSDQRLLKEEARLALRDGDTKTALAALHRIEAADPANIDDRVDLATLLIDAGAEAEARTLVDRLPEQAAAPATYLRACLTARSGDWAAARVALDQVCTQLLPWPRLAVRAEILLAKCYAHLHNPDMQLACAGRALELDSKALAAHLQRADALVQLGQVDQAVQQYRRIYPYLPQARMALAELLIQQQRHEPSVDRRWDEVQTLLDGLPPALASTSQAQLLKAEMLADSGHAAEALQLLEKAKRAHPKQIEWPLALAAFAERQGKSKDARRILEETGQRFSRPAAWFIASIEFWAYQGGRDAVRALRTMEQDVPHVPLPGRIQVLRALAEAYPRLGDSDAALRVCRQLAEQDPHDLGSRLRLLETDLNGGHRADAEHRLQEIHTIDGTGGPYASYAEALLDLWRAEHGETDKLEEARRLALQAKAMRPSWAAAAALQGGVFDVAGDPQKAVEKYQEAVRLGDRRVSVLRRSFDLLYGLRRYQDAKNLLNQVPAIIRDQPQFCRREANLLVIDLGLRKTAGAERQRARAFTLARKAVAADSKNYQDWLWLGRIAAKTRGPKAAEASLRHAVDVAPNQVATWLALLRCEIAFDHKKAAATLQEAGRRLPAEQRPFVLAPGYEALDDRKQAAQEYAAGLNAQPRNVELLQNAAGFYVRTGDTTKARACLATLESADLHASVPVRAWTRRQQAQLLLKAGGYSHWRDALRLVDQNLQDVPTSLDDLHMRARVLAAEPSSRSDAITLFEKLDKIAGLTTDERFLLAQLYTAGGAWPAARAEMLRLLSHGLRQPRWLEFFAKELLHRHDASSAATWIRALADLEPTAATTVELRARLLDARGQKDEAKRMLVQEAKTHPKAIVHVAAVLEDLIDYSEAEMLYRQAAARPDRPDNQLLLALFFGRQHRPKEAFELAHRAWQTCRPDIVAAAEVAILNNADKTVYRPRVERDVDAAVARHPDNSKLLSVKGQLRSMAADYPRAAEWYRRALEHDPRDVVALNNLAWIYATQEHHSAEALDLIDRAINVSGPQPAMLDTRASILISLGRPTDAVTDLNLANKQAPRPSYYLHLAQAYFALGDVAESRSNLSKARDLGLTESHLQSSDAKVLRTLLEKLGVD
jgi:cellulose synthase operon protein C